jgi:aspartyl-tRNA(Asn)/glutamyl-tRNA(Gln) amidotransferase subunit A
MGSAAPRSIRELGAAYRSGSLSPVAVADEYLRRIKELNPVLNCFITTLGESALKAAEESEKRARSVSLLGPLDGVPVAVKDLIYIEGVRCTAGSKILAGNVATYDAQVVARLKAAGAVLMGTTNLHEFAAGVTSNNPHYGPVRNPWDRSRIAGGSSGGSAAAVASGMSPGAIGTDTAGSIRIPAALCGTYGVKPTYGRVSRLGVIPLASSLDTVGVLAMSPWDAAAMLEVISGHRREDASTVEGGPTDYTAGLSVPFSGAKVGVVRVYFHDLIDPKVEKNFEDFVSRLQSLGCRVDEARLDGIDEVYDRWLPIRRAEATAFHLRWLDTTPELYGDDVRKLLELGREVRAVNYVNAVNARPSMIERFSRSMEPFDFLAVPCTSITAPTIGQSKVEVDGKEVEVYAALNRLTLPFNYVGLPVISIPSGFVEGLPVGVQVVGKSFDEVGILRLAHVYEERFGPPPHPNL